MLKKIVKEWNGSLVFCLLGMIAVSLSTGNSIMDIINTEKIEKLIAERRENTSREAEQERRLLMHNVIDNEDPFTNNDEDEGNLDDDILENENQPEISRALPEVHTISKQLLQRNRHRSGERNHFMHQRGHGNTKPNITGIPDISSILSDLTGGKVEKMFKSDKNSIMVTRKEYLKKDWCKTEPIVQKIREEGCIGRTILNRFCYGQCNSFYIPKNPPRRRRNRKRVVYEDEWDENQSFKSCGFCKPKRASWIIVTLRCPSMTPQFRKKKVQRIKQCKCIAENFNT